ncbi:hypothetical protein U9M48_008418 [Paspalum notatum var. saurae]|uniref:Aminotransferase-like plant mobile domain-containing protein n=1 Tax=Paspalum notatum var. saurae TaxID=547442 RepID=A0AAQ3SPW1_PASNO
MWRRKAAAPWLMVPQGQAHMGRKLGQTDPDASFLPIRSASCAPTGRRLLRPHRPPPPPPAPGSSSTRAAISTSYTVGRRLQPRRLLHRRLPPPLHRQPPPQPRQLSTASRRRASVCCLLRRMADPQYLLLDPAIELEHRAACIAEGEELAPLRGRTHTHHLSWDERYAPYIQEAGMLDLARVVTSGLPPLDPALLTALVDRWRTETHTFHLPRREMTITLEDTAMILGLPMDGSPVIHRLDPVAWPGQVQALFGIAPPQRVPGDRSTRLRQHFGVCPPDVGPLCDGCQRKENSSSIGGCLYLLQEWAFEDSRPTVLWFWRDVEVVTGRIDGRYKRYTNELDCVTHRQVEWTPYYREEIEEAELRPLCRRDEDLWRAIVPLIFFVVVEYHIPTRVLRQFGRREVVPPHTVPTDLSLHRRGRYSETDWRITHVVHTGRWDARQRVPVEAGEAHDEAYFVEYLRWLQAHTRVRLQPTADHRPMSEVDSDESDEYDTRTRQGGQQLVWLTNEAGSVLARAGPRPSGALKSFVQTVSRHCRRLSRKIGCYSSAALPPQPRGVPGGPSSSRGQSSWRSRSSKDEDDDEDDDGDHGPDVLFGSQLYDAPPFTQTQHDAEAGPSSQPLAIRRRRRARDPLDVDSGNRINTRPARKSRPHGR